VTVYYPNGKYMKTIYVMYWPWDIAILPKTHRAVVTFANKKMQFINLQTFTQDDKLMILPNSTAIACWSFRVLWVNYLVNCHVSKFFNGRQ
jgi:hypothetical protein